MNTAFSVVEKNLFVIHDFLSSVIAKHLFNFKRIILIIAHLSLFAFLLPELRRDFGELAGNLLIAILFLSPLARITRMRLLNQLMSLRRELGILMAYLAIVHGVGYMIDPAWAEVIFVTLPLHSVFGSAAMYFYGMVALILTMPLLITSNNFSQKHLGGKNWKRVHRLVYGAFIFAVLHRFFQRGDAFSLAEAIILLGSYLVLKLYAWKPFIPFVNSLLARIGADYRGFSLEKKKVM